MKSKKLNPCIKHRIYVREKQNVNVSPIILKSEKENNFLFNELDNILSN